MGKALITKIKGKTYEKLHDGWRAGWKAEMTDG